MPHSVRRRRARANRVARGIEAAVVAAGVARQAVVQWNRQRMMIRSDSGRVLRGSEQQSGGGSHSSFTRHRGKFQKSTRKLIDVSEEYTYKYSGCSNLVGATANQGFDDVPRNGANLALGLGSVGDLQQILVQMGIAVANQNGYHFTVPFQKLTTQYTNCCNYPIVLWLYDVIPRVHTYTTIPNDEVQTPSTAWGLGYTQEGGTGSDQRGTPYSTPFESKLFCEFYKVIKVHKVTMGAGDVHTHTLTNMQHNWISDQKWRNISVANGNSSISQLAHYSVLSLAVIVGTPVHDSADAANTHVSLGPSRVDYVWTKEYIARSATYNQRSVTRTFSGGIIGGNPVTNIIANNQAETQAQT
jgi:hypothetical protein